jgi:hypothetical protein
MSGIDNLKPPQSAEEARERGKKGGIASGRTRRKRKSIREGFNAILSAPVKDKATLGRLKEAGADETAQGLLLLRIYQQAIDGDMQAAKLLLTAIGEADYAANEAVRAKTDLAYLRVELTTQIYEQIESSTNFLEALSETADNVWGGEDGQDPGDAPPQGQQNEPTPDGG